MIVINLWGGPGAGKSTLAAGIFYQLKISGANVELITEYAKDMCYEERGNVLSDQNYIFAKQNRRLLRLLGKNIDFAVTDSPLPTGLLYTTDEYFTKFPSFESFVIESFNGYTNYNVVLNRVHKYSPVGRIQSNEEEAIVYDKKLDVLLTKHNIDHKRFSPYNDLSENIATDILRKFLDQTRIKDK